jgi:uncharacterized protein with HEPN domain
MYSKERAYHIATLIKESLEIISSRVKHVSSVDEFLISEAGMMRLDSICMKLTAMGESVKNLDKITNHELLPNYPEIPWKSVMGVRDIIVHHYFDVDADEIFRICKEDIPPLYQVLLKIISDLSTK